MTEDILKETCNLAGQLSQLLEKTKNKDHRQKLWARYEEIIQQIDQLAYKKFEENDIYLETIKKIKDTRQVIDEFKANKIEFFRLIIHLGNTISGIHKLLLAWRASNENS